MEEFRNYCHQMKELADAGAIPDDVLATNFEERQTYMAGGKQHIFCGIPVQPETMLMKLMLRIQNVKYRFLTSLRMIHFQLQNIQIMAWVSM